MEQEETRRKPTVRGMWEEILRLVYPPKCVFCGALLERAEQDACKPCLAELPWTDTHSAVQTGRAFSQCVSPFFLTGKVHRTGGLQISSTGILWGLLWPLDGRLCLPLSVRCL